MDKTRRFAFVGCRVPLYNGQQSQVDRQRDSHHDVDVWVSLHRSSFARWSSEIEALYLPEAPEGIMGR